MSINNKISLTERFPSLDIFRGLTVALMILVNNPGSRNHLFSPLAHASWHGWTLTDLVFPFFLFAVGNALAFVMFRDEKLGSRYFIQKVAKRTLLIFLIGLLLNWLPFFRYEGDELVFKSWTYIQDGNIVGIRILGVLQRIALSYFLAAMIIHFFKTTWTYIGFALLLFYWWLCWFFGGNDPYSLQGFFGTAVDLRFFGAEHLYREGGVPFDPEGLMATLSSTVVVMMGYTIGRAIQIIGKADIYLMRKIIFTMGITYILLGVIWSYGFPLNKKIWSSSFTLFTSGLASMALLLIIYFVEFKKWNGIGSKFFNVFGKNPLFIFVLSGLIPRVLSLIRIPENDNGKTIYLSPLSWFYEHICKNIASDLRIGSLFYALTLLAFYWLIVYILDRNKIYIKV